MTIAISTNLTIANAGANGGSQVGAKVAQLTGGGYVVAWTSTIPSDPNGGNVVFRLFDANGNPTSAIQQASTQITNNEAIQDIIANSDGTFTIAFTTTGPGGAAPVGYGATGTLEEIGVVRSFNSAGTPQGLETQVFVSGVHDDMDSMKLVNAGSSSNFVYFGQSNVVNTLGGLFKSAAISTTGPGTVALATLLNNYATTVDITDVTSFSTTSDALFVNSERLFSDNAAAPLFDLSGETFVKIQEGFALHLARSNNDGSLVATALSGTGNIMTNYVGMGSVTLPIPGALTGLPGDFTNDIRTENLGGGRLLIVYTAVAVSGVPSGVYGVVFNGNTLTFEGSPSLIIEGQFLMGNISMDLLADGRVAIAIEKNFGFSGGDEIVVRIVDARDGLINADSDPSLSLAGDAAGFRIDLQSSAANTGAAATVSGNFLNVIGGSGADQIYGDVNGNILKGGSGDDVIDGRTGADIIFGEDGADTLSGGATSDQLNGGAGTDTLNGGSGDDVLLGGDDDDGLYGGTENDVIDGGNGDDSVYGGTGNDSIDGGAGNDRLFGGAGDDIIAGNIGNDLIYDQDGDDTVDAGAGNDIVAAGAGTDILNGGINVDTVSYAARTDVAALLNAGFVIDLEESFDFEFTINPNAVREDVLIGFESATGSIGNDVIVGTAGVNVLRGGAGDDLIYSRGGADTIFTGIGADSIYIAASNEGADLVKDFQQGVDKILLVSSAFGDLNESNITTQFIANATGTAAANSSPQIIFDNSGAGAGELRFDADGNGAGASVVIAKLTFTTNTGLLAFSSSDIDFI